MKFPTQEQIKKSDEWIKHLVRILKVRRAQEETKRKNGDKSANPMYFRINI